MNKTPKNMRLHIGIFGRRNVGKSSILNMLTQQQTALVSEVAGTTTDPVEKPMELLPLGPVLFIDTAGIDDKGALGALRIERTRQVVERADMGLLVTTAGEWTAYEQELARLLRAKNIPVVVVVNKADQNEPTADFMDAVKAEHATAVITAAVADRGLTELRQALLNAAPADFFRPTAIAADLVGPGQCAVLVVPIDKEAPKGRLILPQVQTIRDLLDHDSMCVVVKERELREALRLMSKPPALVVTDSQAFLKVAADTPPDVPLTSFSILFARHQGDLTEMVRGALAIGRLKPGARILIAEACSHHPIGEDIGTVKIPRWLTQYVGGKLDIVHTRGHDFPADIASYSLIIHCGACMWNRKEMLQRIARCRDMGVPITNYGLAISYSLGIFERALGPFPAALEVLRQEQEKSGSSAESVG